MAMQGRTRGTHAGIPIDWLLEGEPFVKYRTLVDLAGLSETDKEVKRAKREVPEDPLVARILSWQNRHGYWGGARAIHTWWPKKDTTFWVLGVLADFGLSRGDGRIGRACEYVMGTQLPCGAFGWGPPPTPGECFTGILTESMAKLGYATDGRLRRAYEWLVGRQRIDGGFWCKNTGQPGGPREDESSCAFGTLCVLGALAEYPDLRNSETARRSAEFLLGCWENRGKVKYAGHDSQIGTGWDKLKYPFTDYRILRYLDTLSRFGWVLKDPRARAMTEMLLSKRDEDGRFRPESIHMAWSDFDFGQKKHPSRWVTLLAYRAAGRIAPPLCRATGA